MAGKCELDSCDSEYRTVMGFHEHINEPLQFFLKCRVFLNKLSSS
jgi:hypothetical protein